MGQDAISRTHCVSVVKRFEGSTRALRPTFARDRGTRRNRRPMSISSASNLGQKTSPKDKLRLPCSGSHARHAPELDASDLMDRNYCRK